MPGEQAPEHERREQILSAAFRVAATEGVSAVTSRQVAAEAGLSVGSILFHFGSMDALVFELLEWWLERLSASLNRAGPVSGGQRSEPMVELLDSEIRRVARDPASAALFFDFLALGTRRPEIRARVRTELGRYRDTFQRSAAESLSGHADQEVSARVAALAVALVQGYAVQMAIDPDAVPKERYLELAASLLRCAAGRTAGPPPGADR